MIHQGTFQLVQQKLNLKRLSLHDDVPPELPVRHFSVDDGEDLPPPIPERKGSLEMIIDEDFQGRFSFRPISTVPLPEPLSGIKKTYPSQAPRRNAIQRPPSQPPPPPPPPADELTTASQSSATFNLSSSSRWSSQYEFDDDLEEDFPLPPPPPTVSGTQDTSIKPTDDRKSAPTTHVSTLPPPPTRPPPPAPQTKKPQTSLSTFPSSPSLLLAPNTVQPSDSPKLQAASTVQTTSSSKFTKNTTRSKKPNPPALKSAKSEPNLVSPHLAPGTTSPPPPPIPVRPPLLCAAKPQPTNGLHEIGVPPVVPPNKSQHHPKLPLKPIHQAASVNSKEKPESGDSSTKQNGVIKNADSKSSQQSSEEQTSHSPQKSPLPPRQGRPSPDASQFPNRNRPLPSLPKPVFDKKSMHVKKWAGPEVYDPREEDGDLYDVMDSTNM
ncbi:unnamed protein product [Lymnaea stagnalis]|uniref:Uncharacterized protein n=1 Tax=Lymnaea stagnalis TaxID=6523 RepID=A0AAV2HUJ4_LYMST